MISNNINRLTITDINSILTVERASFSMPWSEDSYRFELTQNPLSYYWGCFDEQRLVGFIGFWLIIDEAHIANVAVDQQYRRRGIGELLLRFTFADAMAKGAKGITLEVRESNQIAINLYQKLGFTEAGRRPHYYSDNDEAAIIMWKHFAGDQNE